MTLTAEQRYRQAVAKDNLLMKRNMRLWRRGDVLWLEGSRLREFIIQQINAAYLAGKAE